MVKGSWQPDNRPPKVVTAADQHANNMVFNAACKMMTNQTLVTDDDDSYFQATSVTTTVGNEVIRVESHDSDDIDFG